jgi:Putative F0F1-ATPase subunit Ca2+/Mg2+ transporter
MDDPQHLEPAEGGSSPDRPPSSPDPAPPLGPAAVAFLSLGIAWAAALALGWFLGYLLDRWAGTSPLFALIGLAFGVVIAVLMTVDRIRKYL